MPPPLPSQPLGSVFIPVSFFSRDFGRKVKFGEAWPRTRQPTPGFYTLCPRFICRRAAENMERFRCFMPQFAGNTCARPGLMPRFIFRLAIFSQAASPSSRRHYAARGEFAGIHRGCLWLPARLWSFVACVDPGPPSLFGGRVRYSPTRSRNWLDICG